ncbi:MAG: putative DNA-binding domain-containing protein [Candidatus Thiothrix moscowensis]|nr:putative DNA-binding domain-containing protein [Candidatus Thiothrix moscowensis]
MNATQAYQRAFAAHLRDPQANPLPAGVNPARAGVYVELLFNNVEDFLSHALPVTRSLLDDAQWHGLVRQFYAEHACLTPYFRDISAEFVQWLSGRFATTTLSEGLPFLLELVHYEWVEIPLLLDPTEINWHAINPEGDLLTGLPVLNPVMLLQSYQYPVHRIGADALPTDTEPTHLALLRDPQRDKIHFVELNAATMRLLQLLQADMGSRDAIQQLALEMQHPDPQQLLHFAGQILTQLHTQQVILGTAIRQA